MKQYDSLILGFGKAGKTLAARLAAAGKTVALVERSPHMYGGTCINVGCIPSKSLVRSAALSKLHAGAPFAERAALYADAVEQRGRLTASLRDKNLAKVAQLENATVYTGTASFLSPTQVRVQTDSGALTLEAKQIFINTGASAVLPPIVGLEGNPHVYTSETLMEQPRLPRRLTIIGSGYIGLEFASMYANFGAQVTVLQDHEAFLPREDEDVAAAIHRILEDNGVSFRLGATMERVESGDGGATLSYVWQGRAYAEHADAVLVATGRRPNTDGLNTAAAGVALTERGAVRVDDALRTTAPGVWAMGDVNGGQQFTYVSLDDFRVVWSQLNGGDYTRAQRGTVPYSVFLDPPYSRVGLNEREARAAGYRCKIARLPAAAIPKAQVLQNPAGLLKAVLDEDTGRILGAMLLCEESYEMINLVKLAMDLGAPYSVLRDRIYTHPTMTEAFNDLFAV